VNSFSDFNLYNNQHPDVLSPMAKKPMPFPLENLDAELGDVYMLVDRIHSKIKAARRNPINNTKARQSRLDSLQYKTKTVLRLIKTISEQSQDLFY
jgi:hypothetical protein